MVEVGITDRILRQFRGNQVVLHRVWLFRVPFDVISCTFLPLEGFDDFYSPNPCELLVLVQQYLSFQLSKECVVLFASS